MQAKMKKIFVSLFCAFAAAKMRGSMVFFTDFSHVTNITEHLPNNYNSRYPTTYPRKNCRKGRF